MASHTLHYTVQGVRKGNFPVIADNHTLILNWNSYTLPLLRQISVGRKERGESIYTGYALPAFSIQVKPGPALSMPNFVSLKAVAYWMQIHLLLVVNTFVTWKTDLCIIRASLPFSVNHAEGQEGHWHSTVEPG